MARYVKEVLNDEKERIGLMKCIIPHTTSREWNGKPQTW
jgi:hypothetical protein